MISMQICKCLCVWICICIFSTISQLVISQLMSYRWCLTYFRCSEASRIVNHQSSPPSIGWLACLSIYMHLHKLEYVQYAQYMYLYVVWQLEKTISMLQVMPVEVAEPEKGTTYVYSQMHTSNGICTFYKYNPLVEKKTRFVHSLDCQFTNWLFIFKYIDFPQQMTMNFITRDLSASPSRWHTQQGLPLLLNGYAILMPQHDIISLDASIWLNEAKVNQLSF